MNTWEEHEPLLPQDRPRWFVPALAWLLIALFTTAMLAAIFVKVPETVHAPFVLVPEGGADPVQAPRQAVIEQVLVRPGQQVKKGDRLFLLRVDEVREWRTEADTRGEALDALRQRARNLEEAYLSAVRLKESEIEQTERDVAFRRQHAGVMHDLVSRVEKLAASGLLSDIELTSHRLALAQSQKDLDVAEKTLAQRRIERQRLTTERGRQRIDEKSAEQELSIRIAALQQPLSTSANGLLEIRAPFDAICTNVTQQNEGSVVAPGSPLAQLSPMSGRLQAHLALPQTGLSRLRTGQNVRLLFDAFPYQRYGVVRGTMEWISPAAIARAERQAFEGFATLEENEIGVGATSYPLRAGMGGTARITVGRRALIEYVFEPLRQLRENLVP
ncbi:MAG: HlyD family efflux transporter periplasmic adaptor subunit [Thermoanaerobaculia bacterium]